MANRHAHKKLRAEVLSRMRTTGEGYQQALAGVLSRRSAAKRPCTDLVALSYFGIPLALATIEAHGISVAMLVPSSRSWRHGDPAPSHVPLMRAALRSRGTA